MKKNKIWTLRIALIFSVLFLIALLFQNLKPTPIIVSLPEKYYTQGTGAGDSEFDMEMSSEKSLHTDYEVNESNVEIKSFRKAIANYSTIPPVEIFQEYYNKIGPKAMLSVIEEKKYCHSIGHPLGRAIFNRTQDLGISMGICGAGCTSGCFHGVLMELLSEVFPKSRIRQLGQEGHFSINFENASEFFEEFCNKPEVLKFIVKGNCYHAIGHGVLFASDYDLVDALSYCRSLKDDAAVFYCATGVFMEYKISSENFHENRPVLYPCQEIQDFPAACYRYMVTDLIDKSDNRSVERAIEKCLGMNRTQRLGCFYGLGYPSYRAIDRNPELLNKVCMHGNEDDNKMCIDSAVELIAVYNLTSAIKACNTLNGTMKDYCMQEIKFKTFNMNKPLGLYYTKN